MSRLPSRGSWLRLVERRAPAGLPLARKIAETPGRGTLTLADLEAGDDRMLAALTARDLVHIFPDGGIDRRAGYTRTSQGSRSDRNTVAA